MEVLLQRLIQLQTEQNELLKKHLWRLKFSLLTLLVLTTAICCGLGLMVYQERAARRAVVLPAPTGVRGFTFRNTIALPTDPDTVTFTPITPGPAPTNEVPVEPQLKP